MRFWNYCWKLNVPTICVWHYNPENGIKLEKVEGGILELKFYVLLKLYMVKSPWQTHGNNGRGSDTVFKSKTQKYTYIIIYLSFLNCDWLLIREVQWFYWTQKLLVPVEKFTVRMPKVRLELATPGLQTQCFSYWALQLKAIAGKELSLSSWIKLWIKVHLLYILTHTIVAGSVLKLCEWQLPKLM